MMLALWLEVQLSRRCHREGLGWVSASAAPSLPRRGVLSLELWLFDMFGVT